MILSDKEASSRLSSQGNLMNRLSSLKNERKNAMSLFIPTYRRSNNERETLQHVRVAENPFAAQASPVKEAEAKEKQFNPFEKPEPLPEDNSLAVRLNQTVAEVEQKVSSSSPKLEELVENSDEQVRLGLAHDKALSLLTRSLEKLDEKIDDVSASKLPSAIVAASKVVEAIRKERIEVTKSKGKDAEVHYHFYTPAQRNVSEYEVIDVAVAPVESSLY